MATKDKNQNSSKKDEHKKNKSSTPSENKKQEAQAGSSSNINGEKKQEQQTGDYEERSNADWQRQAKEYQGPQEGHGFNQTGISQASNQRGEFPRGGYPQGSYHESRYGQGAYSVGHHQRATGNPYEKPSFQQDVRPYYGGGDAPQQYGDYSQEAQPFSDSANERQRVGQSSDQNWWDSGTNQQRDTFQGNTGYPYRENNWGRNQQGQAGIENFYPLEPASEQQRQNFAEGSQYPYEGGYGAENIQAREGLERANEWKGPRQKWDQGESQNNKNTGQQTYGGGNQYPYGGNTGERNQQGPYEEQKGDSKQTAWQQNPQQQSYGGNNQYPYGGNYGERSPQGLDQRQQKGAEDRNDRTPGWVENQRIYNAAQEAAGQDYTGNADQNQPQQQFRNLNQEKNQNQHTMRSDDRNFGREYNDYYRNEDYGRGRREDEDFSYGNNRRRDEAYDRYYHSDRFNRERDFNRDYNENRSFGRGSDQGSNQDYNRNYGRNENYGRYEDYNRYGQENRGQYHSSDQPDRAYNSESEMNRNSGNYYQDYDRIQREGNYGSGSENRVYSRHRETGPYEDFERDLDRFGLRDDYGRNRDRDREQVHSQAEEITKAG